MVNQEAVHVGQRVKAICEQQGYSLRALAEESIDQGNGRGKVWRWNGGSDAC